MEEKRREAGTQPVAGASDSSALAEPTSSRRRAGAHKRKAGNLSGAASNSSSSMPSKRMTREKASLSLHSPIHNGPLTRARQGPSNLASAAAVASASAAAGVRGAGFAVDKPKELAAAQAEALERRKESELEALEAAIEADFEALRSRGANAHVVPSHCGELQFETLICLRFRPGKFILAVWPL